MRERRRVPRPPQRVQIETRAAVLLPAARDAEVARFLHPQPPLPVPSRGAAPSFAGRLAYQLLGHRIITAWG